MDPTLDSPDCIVDKDHPNSQGSLMRNKFWSPLTRACKSEKSSPTFMASTSCVQQPSATMPGTITSAGGGGAKMYQPEASVHGGNAFLLFAQQPEPWLVAMERVMLNYSASPAGDATGAGDAAGAGATAGADESTAAVATAGDAEAAVATTPAPLTSPPLEAHAIKKSRASGDRPRVVGFDLSHQEECEAVLRAAADPYGPPRSGTRYLYTASLHAPIATPPSQSATPQASAAPVNEVAGLEQRVAQLRTGDISSAGSGGSTQGGSVDLTLPTPSNGVNAIAGAALQTSTARPPNANANLPVQGGARVSAKRAAPEAIALTRWADSAEGQWFQSLALNYHNSV